MLSGFDNISTRQSASSIDTGNSLLPSLHDFQQAWSESKNTKSQALDQALPQLLIETREFSEPVLTTNFGIRAQSIMAKLDASGTNEVTRDQLGMALQNHSFHGQELQVLASLYENFDKLHDLSKHEWFFSQQTITASDLNALQEIDNTVSTLTQNILNKPSAERSKLLTELSNKDDYKLISSVYETCRQVALNGQFEGVSHLLYNGGAGEAIRPDAVHQGVIGDCYFEAVVASLAQSNPKAIANMIKDNADGSFTVTFPGAPDEPVTVTAPTEAELGLFNAGGSYGTWASVLEKAYGKFRDNQNWFSNSVPQEAANSAGRAEPVIKLLTGKDATLTVLENLDDRKAIADALTKAFSSTPQKIVSAAVHHRRTWSEWYNNVSLSSNSTDGFPEKHQYSILGFTPNGKGGGMVKIRNPWGGQNGTTFGTIEVPLETFMRNFHDLSIEA
ncbi:MAG TPA: C2 family cysteine protease [Oculatellaceae cyanobacterium]